MGSKQQESSLAEGLGDRTACLHTAKVTQWHPETIQDSEFGKTSENREAKSSVFCLDPLNVRNTAVMCMSRQL